MKTVFWNQQGFRIAIGVVLLLLGTYIAAQYAMNFKSNKGIINTNTSVLVSPVAGFVTGKNAENAQWVTAGEKLLTVENRLLDYSYINELRTEKETLIERVRALRIERDDHILARQNLEYRFNLYLEWQRNSTQRRIAKLNSKKQTLLKLYDTADRIVEINQDLVGGQIISEIELQNTVIDRDEYLAEVRDIEITIAELQTQLDALENKTFLASGGNDVPYSLQRMDTVDLEIANLTAQISEFEFRTTMIDKEIAEQHHHLEKMSNHTVISPVNGIIWRSYVENDKHIDPTNELVIIANCENIFVDSIVSNRYVNAVQIGETISVRFLGESRDFSGTVVSIYGASMKSVDRIQPAILPEVDGDEIIVRIKINPADLPNMQDNFCYIGRQVSVKFNRDYFSSLPDMLGMLTSAF